RKHLEGRCEHDRTAPHVGDAPDTAELSEIGDELGLSNAAADRHVRLDDVEDPTFETGLGFPPIGDALPAGQGNVERIVDALVARVAVLRRWLLEPDEAEAFQPMTHFYCLRERVGSVPVGHQLDAGR